MSPKQNSAWSDDDQIMLYTCKQFINFVTEQPIIQTNIYPTFTDRLHEHDVFIGNATYSRSEYKPIGDGSHQTVYSNTGFSYVQSFGSAAIGISRGIGSINNKKTKRNRKRAYNDLQPRWVPEEHGNIYVSYKGLYSQPHNQHIYIWAWHNITDLDLRQTNVIEIKGNDDNGYDRDWLIQSSIAELIFITWAWAQNRNHPRLAGGQWIPEGWLQWAQAQNRITTEEITIITKYNNQNGQTTHPNAINPMQYNNLELNRAIPLSEPDYYINFSGAIKRGFQKYFIFSGQASRKEFWCWIGFMFILLMVSWLLRLLTYQLTVFAVLFTIVPTLSVTARRLHDAGHTAWWIPINFIPGIGMIFLIIFLLKPSIDPLPPKPITRRRL